ADEEAMDPRPFEARVDADVLADQRIGDADGDPLEPGTLEDDGVLDLAAVDEAAGPDRRVRPDERVADLGARSHDPPAAARAALSRPSGRRPCPRRAGPAGGPGGRARRRCRG